VLQKRTIPQKLLELTKELQQVDSLKDFVLAGDTALALQIGHRSDIYHVKKSLIYFNDLPPDSWASVNLLKKNDLTLAAVKNRLTGELKNFDCGYENINSVGMENASKSRRKPASSMKRHNIDDGLER
jgi:hypothetical protein